MEITIADVKSLCRISEKENVPEGFVGIGSDYTFSSFNSKTLFPNNQIKLTGILCLHKRNYKPILIDKSDWIYIEFLDCFAQKSQDSDSSNNLNLNTSSSSYARINYLLKHVTIELFNVFIEEVNLQKKADMTSDQKKVICYLQTDLAACTIGANSYNTSKIGEDERVAMVKTMEIRKLFKDLSNPSTHVDSDVINETLDDLDQSVSNQDPTGLVLDLNGTWDSTIENYYLIKVLNKGPIHSLANTQFKGKLRADVRVELHSLNKETRDNKPICIILALMSKFLYFYNFLYTGNSYLLRTSSDSIYNQIKGSNNVQPKQMKQDAPTAILFFDETMSIIDEFTLRNYAGLDSIAKDKAKVPKASEDCQYVSEISGTLIEKRLMTNSNLGYGTGFNTSSVYLAHFDVLLSNLEFRLMVKTGPEEVVTIYYDTRFLLYPFCILPGMRVSLSNLIKRNDGAYKSNTMLSSTFRQDFNLLNELVETDVINSTLELSSQRAKKTLLENLSELSSVYEHFYLKPIASLSVDAAEVNDSEYQLNLLFKCSDRSESQLVKVMALIIKIFDLELRIKCRICQLLASSCSCSDKEAKKGDFDNYNVELNTTFLIDDHTSIVRVHYCNADYDMRGQEAQLFGPIASGLKQILLNYLNEIKLPNIPLQVNHFDCGSSDEHQMLMNIQKMIREGIRDKIVKNESSSTVTKFINSNTSSNESVAYDCQAEDWKLDIYKTVYDYLVNCVLEKYFIFYIDSSLSGDQDSRGNRTMSTRTKLANSLFNLNSVWSNEQYKSLYTMKCYKYLPITILNN